MSLSIGEVLAELQPDFPGITISKIRFLESTGLIEPQRTAAGYRRFDRSDIARLRYILTAQRDHYLPLRVIKDHLDALDRGLEPPAVGLPGPRVPAAGAYADPSGAALLATVTEPTANVRITRSELADAAGLTDEGLAELEEFGLISSGDGAYLDGDALLVARTVAALGEYGLQPRHLRMVKAAAGRQVDLIEQVVTPLVAHRGADSWSRAEEAVRELAALLVRLHAVLVKSGVTRALPVDTRR